jgi:hypothetical protein
MGILFIVAAFIVFLILYIIFVKSFLIIKKLTFEEFYQKPDNPILVLFIISILFLPLFKLSVKYDIQTFVFLGFMLSWIFCMIVLPCIWGDK